MLDEIQNFLSLDYWRSFLKSPTKKKLTENFLSLSLLQGLNYILPLITLPYVVRVLGVEKFGLIAFAQAFLGYFVIVVAYGFNLSATREISINRENKEKVSEIFSSVIFAKIILACLSFLVLLSLLFLVPKFRTFWLLYLLMFEIVIWDIIFPVWFFQGVEKMKFITMIAFLSKLITVVFIFVLIKKPSDYILYPVVDFIGNIIAGAWAIKIILKNFKVKLKVPGLENIKYQFKEGWHIFISNLAISLYTTSNTFILGIFTNNIIVGYYAGAEKILKAALGVFSPLSQAVYPHINKLLSASKEKAIKFIRKLFILMSGGTFVLSLIIFIFSGTIINIILGNNYQNSIGVLRILAFLPFIVGLSNVFGIQTMIPFNFKKAFSRILIFAGLLNVFLLLVLIPFLKEKGVAVSWLATEIFVTTSMFFYLEKKGIKIFSAKINDK